MTMDIQLDVSDGIARIRMDDGKKNAFDLAGLADLNEALDQAEAKSDALVLVGRPGSFCAGFDMASMIGGDPAVAAELGRTGGGLALRLFRTPKPVVAACTGHAFTIGALWLLASDTRIGEEGSFKLSMTETKLGVGLPEWALELLERCIARPAYVAVVAQSKAYDPAGAVAAGFLDEVVPGGEAEARALAIAAELAKLPAPAYATNKLARRARSIEIMERDLAP